MPRFDQPIEPMTLGTSAIGRTTDCVLANSA
jgi:hypothetical protein